MPSEIETRAKLAAEVIRTNLAAELIGALYRAILGRDADPTGAAHYAKMFDTMPLPKAVEVVAASLLYSQERAETRPKVSIPYVSRWEQPSIWPLGDDVP